MIAVGIALVALIPILGKLITNKGETTPAEEDDDSRYIRGR